MDVGNSWAGPGYPGATKDTTIINKVMLRFRPIAPKPVANSSGSGSAPETHKLDVVGKRRTKRKYVRVKKNNKCKNKKEEKEKSDGSLVLDDNHQTVVTLQLLPESSGGVKSSPENRSYPKSVNFSVQERSIWMNKNILSIGVPDPSVEIRSPMVVESSVMVDGITNSTFVDISALGSTDMEKMMNLEGDTCPGFISDGLDCVKWVNLAYRRMIDPVEDGGEPPEMAVRLVVKENKSAPLLLSSVFACTVRIVYTWNKVKQSRTMPCDVWKMDFGGFAWRFDAKASLSLGR